MNLKHGNENNNNNISFWDMCQYNKNNGKILWSIISRHQSPKRENYRILQSFWCRTHNNTIFTITFTSNIFYDRIETLCPILEYRAITNFVLYKFIKSDMFIQKHFQKAIPLFGAKIVCGAHSNNITISFYFGLFKYISVSNNKTNSKSFISSL